MGRQITRVEFDPNLAQPLRGDSLLSLDLARPGFEGTSPAAQAGRYAANLESCSGAPTSIGAPADVFHASGSAYTADPLEALIDSDPAAAWDAAQGAVVGSAFNVSPRIITIAVVDPEVISAQNRSAPLAVTGPIRNFVGFFVQSADGGGSAAEVTGVIVPAPGQFDAAAPLVTESAAFLRTVALVR
jgi:hypothetical protein